jgi:signal transduction histidine kinase
MLALTALGLLLARTRRLYRKLDRVAAAEHELRGAAMAIALVCQAWRRSPGALPPVEALEVQLDRLTAGLADLGEARGEQPRAQGRTGVDLWRFLDASLAPWRSSVMPPGGVAPAFELSADRGRLAQALGNLIANAAEHGRGPAEVRALPIPAGIRLELRNRRGPARPADPGRGRGLAIADRAARDLGGRLQVRVEGDEVVAALELPADRGSAARAA